MATMKAAAKFRESFKLPVYFMPQIFSQLLPAHQAKGMSAMRGKVNYCDYIIEVRDARLPLSSCNPQFEYLYRDQPRIILLNKIDLANVKRTQAIAKEYIENEQTKVIYGNCKYHAHRGLKSVMANIRRSIAQNKLENIVDDNEDQIESGYQEEGMGEFDNKDEEGIDDDEKPKEKKTTKALVCGIPNVGKSTFINKVRAKYTKRKSKATNVGKIPGITRSVLSTIVISDNPRIVIYDTPGITPPNVSIPETGLKLAIIGTYPDHRIGEDVIADYLLYTLNKRNNKRYLEFCGLTEPSDDFDHVISSISEKYGIYKKGNKPCYLKCSQKLLAGYRNQLFGRLTID